MTPDEHLQRLETEADRQGQEIAQVKAVVEQITTEVAELTTAIRNTTNAARKAL